MALSALSTVIFTSKSITAASASDNLLPSSLSTSRLSGKSLTTHNNYVSTSITKWRTNVSFLPSFLNNRKGDATTIKQELLQAIAPLDRGAQATPEDQQRVDLITRKLEAVNPTKEPLKSDLLNGKWELLYTTSESILQIKRPKFLRSKVNYQAINADILRAQNMESWPFFNQVTADLTPVNAKKVAVKFDFFKIGGLVRVKAPDRAVGALEITYLDEDLRFSSSGEYTASIFFNSQSQPLPNFSLSSGCEGPGQSVVGTPLEELTMFTLAGVK